MGWAEFTSDQSSQRETRDFSNDSFALLYGTSLQKDLSNEDRKDLSELTALATCDSIIFFEQNLLRIDRAYFGSAPKSESPPMGSIDRDELLHLRAYREYASHSRLYQKFFRTAGGQTLLPGQLGRKKLSVFAYLLGWQTTFFPKFSYIFILAGELFTIEIGSRLLRDFGTKSSDPWVQLNQMHMKDEALHIGICLQHAHQIYKDLNLAERILFWTLSFTGIALSSLISLGGTYSALSQTPSKKKIKYFYLRSFVRLYQVSVRPDSPLRLAMKNLHRHAQTKFHDAISQMALKIIRWAA